METMRKQKKIKIIASLFFSHDLLVMYKITEYSKEKAKKLGVIIKASSNLAKKLDVFNKKGEKIGTCGAIGYGDYPTFIKTKGLEYANARRKLYKIRHDKDRHLKGTNGYWADQLLW